MIPRIEKMGRPTRTTVGTRVRQTSMVTARAIQAPIPTALMIFNGKKIREARQIKNTRPLFAIVSPE